MKVKVNYFLNQLRVLVEIFRDSFFYDVISLKLNTLTRFDVQLKKNNQTKDQTYRVKFI
jgi:hypothetical protein